MKHVPTCDDCGHEWLDEDLGHCEECGSDDVSCHEYMSFDEAVQEFMEYALPQIRKLYEQDGIPDIPARCEAWNNYTDMLCKGGAIATRQYEDWDHPPCNYH